MDEHDTSDAGVGSVRDPAFLRAVRPMLERFASYFRPEVRADDRE